MIKSLIVIGDFFCLNIAYAVVCYWGGGFDGGFGVKIIWLLLNLSYFPVFSLFAKILYYSHRFSTRLFSVHTCAKVFLSPDRVYRGSYRPFAVP